MGVKKLVLVVIVLKSTLGFSQYAPAANVLGTTAIFKDSSAIVSWANKVNSFTRGPQDISFGGSPLVDFGDSTLALGYAEGTSVDVVSFGDGGSIILEFPYPIRNGLGHDFAVFENSFAHDYLEFAHVEVSTDGITFVRFPSISVVQTSTQVGGFGLTDPEQVYNLAGKYIQGYGTPFDLEDIIDSVGLNLDSINYVKLTDVVGSIDAAFGTEDSQGNLINEPFPSAFGSGGFDLDAVGVINENNGSLGVSELKVDINVYPNPTNGILNISTSLENDKLKIFDLSGQLIYQQKFKQSAQIDMSALSISPGVYILKIGNTVNKITYCSF